MNMKDMEAAIDCLEQHGNKRCKTVATWLREEHDRRSAQALIMKQAKALGLSQSEVRDRMKKAGLFPGYVH